MEERGESRKQIVREVRQGEGKRGEMRGGEGEDGRGRGYGGEENVYPSGRGCERMGWDRTGWEGRVGRCACKSGSLACMQGAALYDRHST